MPIIKYRLRFSSKQTLAALAVLAVLAEALEARHSKPGTRSSCLRFSKAGSRSQAPEARHPKPGTRRQTANIKKSETHGFIPVCSRQARLPLTQAARLTTIRVGGLFHLPTLPIHKPLPAGRHDQGVTKKALTGFFCGAARGIER